MKNLREFITEAKLYKAGDKVDHKGRKAIVTHSQRMGHLGTPHAVNLEYSDNGERQSIEAKHLKKINEANARLGSPIDRKGRMMEPHHVIDNETHAHIHTYPVGSSYHHAVKKLVPGDHHGRGGQTLYSDKGAKHQRVGPYASIKESVDDDQDKPPIEHRSLYVHTYAKHGGTAAKVNSAKEKAYAAVEKKHGAEAVTKLKAWHDKNMNESATHYHSIWVKHKDGDGKWGHHFDADNKEDAADEARSQRNSGYKAKVIRVHKDHADWRKPEHVAAAHEKLNGAN